MASDHRARQRDPARIHAFEYPLTAATLGDIPHDCYALCTWVPVGSEFVLKFTNALCPSRRHRL